MSLLSTDQVTIALFPDRLLVSRTRGRFRRRVTHNKEVVDFAAPEAPGPAWQAALQALVPVLSAAGLGEATVTLVLSNHFVHYLVVPWSDGLSSDDEEMAFVRHCFERVYGDIASGWEIRLCGARPGSPRLACAIETTLLDALLVHMGPLSRRYRSLQPHLMSTFNAWAARLVKKTSWLVVAEPGLLCVALLHEGCWQSVRNIKVGADWLDQLPSVLAREEYLVDCQLQCDEVVLLAPDAAQCLPLKSGKWRVNGLAPTDAALSIVL